MPRPEVWFAIPSASPENCRRVLPVWREMGYRTAILQNFERADIPADLVVWSDHYPGWAGSINILAREVVPASAPIIVSGGDDMLPDPNVPADRLAEQFLDRYPDTFGVMQPHGDDYHDTRHYCGSPWLGRAFCDRMYKGRGPMFPGYRHNWADVELYWVAKCRGLLWSRPDLTQRHEHFFRKEQDKPAYWTHSVQSNDFRDVSLYLERKAREFPGHDPIGDAPLFNGRMLALDSRLLAEEHFSLVYHDLPDAQVRAMTGALQDCAAKGHKRIALYGAGLHTRRMAAALEQPPVEIVAIIDDDASRHGTRLWGMPIVSRDKAAALGLDVVVLSSDTREAELWDSSAPLRASGVEVIRLYTAEADPNAPAPALFATSPEDRRRAEERASGLLEADAFAMITRVIDPGQPVVVLDIGANKGDATRRAIDEFPRATVYAFEPAPKMTEALRERFKGHPGVRTIAAAVGDRPGAIDFHVAADDLFSSALPPSELGRHYHDGEIDRVSTVRVPMVAIDQWADENAVDRVDIVKIDVQGLETAVLRGAAEVIRTRGVLAVTCEAPLIREYEGSCTYSEIDAMLNALGFEIHQVHECWTRGPEKQVVCLDALWLRRDALSWLRRHPERAFEIGWRDAFRATLARLHNLGASRVAVYGAGWHTRVIAELFPTSPVPIVAVLDDRATDESAPINGVPVVRPDQAQSLGVDTVVLSSNCHEETLWAASRPLREQGIRVVPLHRRQAEDHSRRAAPASVVA